MKPSSLQANAPGVEHPRGPAQPGGLPARGRVGDLDAIDHEGVVLARGERQHGLADAEPGVGQLVVASRRRAARSARRAGPRRGTWSRPRSDGRRAGARRAGGSDIRRLSRGARALLEWPSELGDRLGHRVDLGRERLHGRGIALAGGGQGGPALLDVLLDGGEVPARSLRPGLHGSMTLTRTPEGRTSGPRRVAGPVSRLLVILTLLAAALPAAAGAQTPSATPPSPSPARPTPSPRPPPTSMARRSATTPRPPTTSSTALPPATAWLTPEADAGARHRSGRRQGPDHRPHAQHDLPLPSRGHQPGRLRARRRPHVPHRARAAAAARQPHRLARGPSRSAR